MVLAKKEQTYKPQHLGGYMQLWLLYRMEITAIAYIRVLGAMFLKKISV